MAFKGVEGVAVVELEVAAVVAVVMAVVLAVVTVAVVVVVPEERIERGGSASLELGSSFRFLTTALPSKCMQHRKWLEDNAFKGGAAAPPCCTSTRGDESCFQGRNARGHP